MQMEAAIVTGSHHSQAIDTHHLERVIAELMCDGSIELSAACDSDRLEQAKALLPSGMSVYIPGLPRQTLLSRLERIRAIHAAGYDPVPHLAARRIPSRQSAPRDDFLGSAKQGDRPCQGRTSVRRGFSVDSNPSPRLARTSAACRADGLPDPR